MKKISLFLFWFIGFNAAFFIFRDAFSIVKLAYTVSILLLALLSLYRLFIYKKAGCPVFFLKMFSIVMALLLCCWQYNSDFFIREIIGTASLFLMWGIFSYYPTDDECYSYLRGYKLSLIIDYIYAGIQLFILLFFNVNITDYLLFYIGHSSEIPFRVSTRIAGLCWDPYVLGIFCATGFFLFKAKIIRLYILVLLYYSSSRAGQLGLLAGCVFYYWKDLKRKLNMRNIWIFFLVLSFIPLVTPFMVKTLNLDRGFSRQSSGWRRVEYIVCFPEVLATDKSIFPAIFGGAPVNSGARFYYSEIPTVTNTESRTPYWGIETDFFGTLYGRGIFGFLIYLYFYFYIFLHSHNKLLKALSACFFAAGFGYYFEFAIFSNFILFFALNKKKNEVSEVKI